MTTSVVITAHCSKDKEVVVSCPSDKTSLVVVLQDGYRYEVFVDDDRAITVYERRKDKGI